MNPLYVVTAISNPVRYKSRARLYHDFAKRVADASCPLITVEAAFGERPFEVTQAGHDRNVQVRTGHELWLKENLLNLGIAHLTRLDPDWTYVAWIDADITFARPDWATETVHQLQHYQVVQMFGGAHDLGPDNAAFDSYEGFVRSYYRWLAGDGAWGEAGDEYRLPVGWHPGYAWAARREAIDAIGRLPDYAILGSADQHLARALVGRAAESINPGMHPNYRAEVAELERRCERHVRRNVGFVAGDVLHHWHGRKANRGYTDRWKVLRELQYDPRTDIKYDATGVLQLVDRGDVRSIQLRDRLRAYFRQRDEDATAL